MGPDTAMARAAPEDELAVPGTAARAQPARPPRAAHLLAGAATSTAWAACAVAALATYKPERVVHNAIGVLAALSHLPAAWACFLVLARAARDRDAPSRAPLARLDLSLAAASAWSAAAVVFAPALTAATVRTSDPVVYAPPLRAAAATAHLAAAALCAGAWRRARASPGDRAGAVARLVSATLAAPWALAPRRGAGAPRIAREYATLASGFASCALLAALAPFPLATVPSLVGKRLARAFGAWCVVAAAALAALKADAEARFGDGGEEDGALDPRDAAVLRRGVLATACLHLAIALARPLLEPASVYPAAMACKPAVVASLLLYALAAEVVLRDGRERTTTE